MNFNRLTVILLAVAGVFTSSLVGVMIWVSVVSAQPGPFQAKFQLVNDRNQPVTENVFKGSPSLVYFGYTNCPEVCPTTLFELSDWMKQLGPASDKLKIYFFSVDPERDTPDVMHAYVTAFSDRITGVTGDPAQMKKVLDGWMIFAEKQPGNGSDYHMNHTTSLLMIGADGRLKGTIPYSSSREDALAAIRSTLLRDVGKTPNA